MFIALMYVDHFDVIKGKAYVIAWRNNKLS